jgi:hypothetical protein
VRVTGTGQTHTEDECAEVFLQQTHIPYLQQKISTSTPHKSLLSFYSGLGFVTKKKTYFYSAHKLNNNINKTEVKYAENTN